MSRIYNNISLKGVACLLWYCFIAVFLHSCDEAEQRNGNKSLAKSHSDFEKVIEESRRIQATGDYFYAKHFLDSSFKVLKPDSLIDQYNYYAAVFLLYTNNLKDYSHAENYADSILYLIEKNSATQKFSFEYIQGNFDKGDALFGLGNYTEAYKYFYKAKSLAQNNLDSCQLDDYTYRLGMVLYKQERYEEAADNFKLSFAEAAYCEYVFSLVYRRQELLDNIGLSYYKVGNTDSAMFYYNKALVYINESEKDFPKSPRNMFEQAKAIVYGNMASIYQDMVVFDKAEDLLLKSIRINEQKGNDLQDAQITRIKLAKLYLQQNNMPATGAMLGVIKQIIDTLPDARVKLSWYGLMAEYNNALKKPQEAYNYLNNYRLLKDSVDKKSKELRETDMGERMKNLDKEYQIQILEKNNEIKRNSLIITLITSILALIIVSLIYDSWRKSKKNINALTELNEQINEQNQKLEKVLNELRASHREKDRILRAVAHDIRNPIAAITALADLLLAETDAYTDEQKELITHIQNACNDALTLSRDILESADPAKAGTLEKEQTNINELVKNSIELLRFRATEKKQEIILDISNTQLTYNVNREKIWRVISNLVTNAVKFSPEGSAIIVNVNADEKGLSITVKDKGIGIPNNIKNKVFDMFTAAKRMGTAGEKPYGLGLSISKHIVEAHGGKIWFENNVDKGTTFRVLIPQSEDENHQAGIPVS